MAVRPPDPEELAAIADRYGLGLTPADLAVFGPMTEGLLASWDAVEALYARTAPAAPERAWSRPEPADNPLGAWYVRTDITEAADGPLAGRTIAVKDNTMVAGVPMMNGSRTVEGFVPVRDATIVTRLLGAGATIAGKAVCEDLCFDGGSHTSKSGPVLNPWDHTRTTGGSSSGSGALVASAAVDMAIGGDQAGSIRIPSAYCGIVGHKPTHGLVPYTGAFPIERTLDHLGPMARTVADVALVLGVIAGADGVDERQPPGIHAEDYTAAIDGTVAGISIGVLAEGFGVPGLSHPGVDESVRAAIGRLESAGCPVEEVSIPWHRDALHLWNVIGVEGTVTQMLEGNAYGRNYGGLYDPELVAHFGRQWRERSAELSETVKGALLAGRHTLDHYHGRHYAMARNLALELRRAYDDALSRVDVLVMPTMPLTATPLVTPETSREEEVTRSVAIMANTAPFDVSGHPATSVPTGLVDGLPAAMMVVGRRYEDATCLRIANAWEHLCGGFPAPPTPGA